MLTLFIPFLLNMDTFACLMPLVHAPAQLYTYAGCTHVCRQGCTHTLRAPVLVLLQSLASFQDIENCLKNNCYLHTGFHNVVPSLQGRFSFVETSVGIPGGVAGRLRELKQEERRPQNGESLTQYPVHQGQSPAASLSAASQDRQAPPVVHHHSSITRSSTGWGWGADSISHVTSGSWSEKLSQLWGMNTLG